MDYRSKTNLERAKKNREKRTKQILLILLIAVLAVVLIVSVVIIAKEAAGEKDTTPEATSGEAPTEQPGTNDTPTESNPASEVPTDPGDQPTEKPTEPGTNPAEQPTGTGTETGADTEPVGDYKDVVYSTNNVLDLGYLLLVNKTNKYLFPETEIKLIPIYENRTHADKSDPEPCSFRMMNMTPKINSFVMAKMNTMFDAMYAVTQDNKVYVSGAYRSKEDQEKTFQKYPATASAPGYSEYHTGFAFSLKYFTNPTTAENVDLDHPSANPEILAWLNANCYKYGFIFRYPSDKVSYTGVSSDRFHLRYVGIPHATYMHDHNLCLEEYLQLVSTVEFSDNHLTFQDSWGQHYEVYYVPATNGTTTTVPVPTRCYYTVEGNNYSGFIVTAYLDQPAA